MAIFCSESINKIKQNKEKLEKELKVKLSFSGKSILIEATDGNAVYEYTAERVLEALELGFALPQALLLCDEEVVLEKIYIKSITKRYDLERVRGRLIGTHGKTKMIIQELSGCFVAVHGNTVGVIGRAEDIKKAIIALTSIIQGQKQSHAYSYLERQRSKQKLELTEDLGLKIKEKKAKTQKKQNKKP